MSCRLEWLAVIGLCLGSVTKGRLRGGGGGGRRRRRRCGGGAKSQPPPSFHLIHIAETDVADENLYSFTNTN